jgi:GTP diphosphokinase / guanosine-3',5'-bis(diphosphate) 3'-diphosphatase
VDELKENFLSRSRVLYGDAEGDRVASALAWTEERHAGKLRASGEGAWLHALRVADTLMGLGLDADSVIAGLLHDLLEAPFERVEDDYEEDMAEARSAQRAREEASSKRSLLVAQITQRFGPSVALLVEDSSRLAALKAKNKTVHASETIRKMLFAMARDIRVIIIKLSD